MQYDSKQYQKELNKNIQRFKTLRLHQWQLELIKLRQQGYTYDEILATLKKQYPKKMKKINKSTSLRTYIYIGGTLKEAYDLWCDICTLHSVIEAKQILGGAAGTAAQTLEVLLSKDKADNVRRQSAVDILNWTVGKPEQILKQTIKEEDEDDLDDEELTEEINKFIDEKNNKNNKKRAEGNIKKVCKKTGKKK